MMDKGKNPKLRLKNYFLVLIQCNLSKIESSPKDELLIIK